MRPVTQQKTTNPQQQNTPAQPVTQQTPSIQQTQSTATQQITQPVTQQITQPAQQNTPAQPAQQNTPAQPVTQQITQSAQQNTPAQPATQQITQPAQQITQPVTQQNTQPATQQITQPATPIRPHTPERRNDTELPSPTTKQTKITSQKKTDLIQQLVTSLEVKKKSHKQISKQLETIDEDLLEKFVQVLSFYKNEIDEESKNEIKEMTTSERVAELLDYLKNDMLSLKVLPKNFVDNPVWKIDDMIIDANAEVTSEQELKAILMKLQRSKHLVVFNTFAVGKIVTEFKNKMKMPKEEKEKKWKTMFVS